MAGARAITRRRKEGMFFFHWNGQRKWYSRSILASHRVGACKRGWEMKRLLGVIASALSVGLLAGVTGCSSDDDEATKAGGTNNLELYSWWAAGGEKAALDELVNEFKVRKPNVPVLNAADFGGGGTVARDKLKQRMADGNPPDSFQVHGGKELITAWVRQPGAADAKSKMEPLNSLFADMKWGTDKFPQALTDINTDKGQIYSVPVNVHQGNVLYYNKEIFTANELQVPTDLESLKAVVAAFATKKKDGTLKPDGISANFAPIAIGAKDAWAITMVFENILLAKAGADYLKTFWAGAGNPEDQTVRDAAQEFADLIKSNAIISTADQYDWGGAAGALMQKEAAMTFMGTWAKGYFMAETANDGKPKEKWTPDTEFSGVSWPNNAFLVVLDTFGLPQGAQNRENCLEWLRVCGDAPTEVKFGLKSGAIPARIDIDPAQFDSLSQKVIADFKTLSLVPSLAHGSAASPEFTGAFNDAVVAFFGNQDIDAFINAIKGRYGQLK